MKPLNKKLLRPKFLIALFVVALPFLYALAPFRFWGNPIKLPPPSPNVSPYAVSLSPDARLALMGGNQYAAWLVDVPAGSVIRRFPASSNMVCSVDLSPDKKTAALCESNGTISLWNAENGSKLAKYSVYVKIDDPDIDDVNMTRYQIALSPDASMLLVNDRYRGLRLLDARKGKTIRVLNERDGAQLPWFDFSPQGDVAYAYNNAKSCMEIFSLKNDGASEANIDSFSLRSATLSPDGKRVFLGGEDGLIRVWDVATQAVVRRLRCPDPVCALYVTSDGNLLYAGGYLGKISVWNLNRLQYVRTFFNLSNPIAALGVPPGATEAFFVDRRGVIWNWDLVQQKNDWRIDGFQFNGQKQIVAAPKVTASPTTVSIDSGMCNDEILAILDRPIDWPQDLNEARLDWILDYVSSQIDVPISSPFVRDYAYSTVRSIRFCDWLEMALENNALNYIVESNGAIHIGRPETLERCRKLDSGKMLQDIPAMLLPAPNQTKYAYIEDIANAIRSVTDVSIVVEDDIYDKITAKLGRETPRRLLDMVLIPNGFDCSIAEGQIYVDRREKVIAYSKNDIFVATSTRPSLNLDEGFAPAQLDEMDRNPDLRLTPEELAVLIVNYHARFETTCFQYTGVDCCSEYEGAALREDRSVPWLKMAKDVMQMRRANLDKFQERIRAKKTRDIVAEWKDVSDERLQAFIENNERLEAGFTRNATRTYTVGKRDRSLEVLWPNERPDRCVYYMNEKNEGIRYLPLGLPRTSDYLRSHFCETPAYPSRFGADLDWFLLRGYKIAAIDWTKRKLLVVPVDGQKNFYTFEITLLDERNTYWKQCNVLLFGRIVRRIDCADFIDVSGMLVPQTVSVRDTEGFEFVYLCYSAYSGYFPPSMDRMMVRVYENIRIGGVRHDYQLKLIEAQVDRPVKEIDVGLERPLHHQ